MLRPLVRLTSKILSQRTDERMLSDCTYIENSVTTSIRRKRNSVCTSAALSPADRMLSQAIIKKADRA